MGRFLNVGLIQMPVEEETERNLHYIKSCTDRMMKSTVLKPDLVLGSEYCIAPVHPEPIPGAATDFLCRIAEEHGIYLVPGTMKESSKSLKNNQFYNAAPIIAPNGTIVDTYRKIAPWTIAEKDIVGGDKFSVFEIKEKKAKIGVQICFDGDFPEISRTLTLMGAEVLTQLSMDPISIPQTYRKIRIARALENQAYFIYTDSVGFFQEWSLVGHSLIVDPEGRIIYEAEGNPASPVVALDLDLVTNCRKYGTWSQVAILKYLLEHNIKQPYANKLRESQLFRELTAMNNVK